MLLLSNFNLTGTEDLLASLLAVVKYFILACLVRERMGEFVCQSLSGDGLAA